MPLLLLSLAVLATDHPLRILLDARILARSGTGISRYTLGLVSAWIRIFPDDEWLFVTNEDLSPPTLGLPDFHRLLIPFPGQTLFRPVWEKVLLPRAMKHLEEPPDVFFSPLGACLSRKRVSIPSVAVVHDLAFLRFPEILPGHYRLYWHWVVRRAVREASGLIAVSNSTRNDLIELLDAPPEAIRTIHEGIDPTIRAEPDETRCRMIRGEWNLPDKFLLFVGTLEPRKNVSFLLDVWEGMGPEAPLLVLAGGWGWLSESLKHRIENMARPPRLLGQVPPDVLAVLYRLASVFVFPSLYEGFGLPLVEAMAAGLPIVALRSSSIPEVVGDAGLLVEAGDRDGFCHSVQRILQDSELAGNLSRRGIQRSQLFTWEKSAQETRQFVNFLLGRS